MSIRDCWLLFFSRSNDNLGSLCKEFKGNKIPSGRKNDRPHYADITIRMAIHCSHNSVIGRNYAPKKVDKFFLNFIDKIILSRF